ncbi:MAG: sterol desaturase family protein [Burkholderiales bacterium]|nr:sterol desaturase family protein [Burkholderiales bacterium]
MPRTEREDSLPDLFTKAGALPRGRGMVSGVIAFALAVLCVLGVAAFHFPEYLTTPELRRQYSVDLLRLVLAGAMLVAGGLAAANLVLGRSRSLNGAGLALVLLAWALGGHRVPVGEFPDHTPYIGLDWFILDLLGSSLVFILIEKLFPLTAQPVFRPGWQTDFVHFMVNHFAVGLVLLVVNFLVHRFFGWAAWPPLQAWIAALPFGIELLLILLAADLVQYWLHRAYHEVPWLWRFHAVHHSTLYMDWMAGSRLHMLELVATRVAVLGAIYVLGFSKEVMDLYIIIVGFQAVFNHANVRLPAAFARAPLKYLVVTPDFHHWHHSSERAALDRNYAAHFAFLDFLFGTAVRSARRFPEKYGVLGDTMPEGFLRQQLFPFTRRHPSP